MERREKRTKCRRVAYALLLAADGELAPDELHLIEAHLEGCAECRAHSTLFRRVDQKLLAFTNVLDDLSPADLSARLQLHSKLTAPERRGATSWIPGVTSWKWAGVAFAAVVLLAIGIRQGNERFHIVARSGFPPDLHSVQGFPGSTAVPEHKSAEIARSMRVDQDPPSVVSASGDRNAVSIRVELSLSPVGNPFLDSSPSESVIVADLVVGRDGLPQGIRLDY
jgi:hypothetical protein